MEYVWYDTNYKLPPTVVSGVEYIATIYSPYWNIPFQTKVVTYDKEDYNGRISWVWKLNGNKIPSTWRVTDWTYMPPPARNML